MLSRRIGRSRAEGSKHNCFRPFFLPLFTGVRGIRILRTSHNSRSRKFPSRNGHLADAPPLVSVHTCSR